MHKNSTIGNDSTIFACLQLCEIALKTKETVLSLNIDGANILHLILRISEKRSGVLCEHYFNLFSILAVQVW